MGVGVWAASTQAVKVTTQVKFTATGVAADVYLKVANGSAANTDTGIISSATSGSGDTLVDWTTDADATNKAGYGQLLSSFDFNTATQSGSTALTIDFVDSNDNGVIDTGTTFTYTFKIDNSTAMAMYYHITLGTQLAAVKAEITKSDLDSSLTGEGTQAEPNGKANTEKEYGTLAASTDGEVVITYTVTAPAAPTVALYNSTCSKSLADGSTLTDAQKAEYYKALKYSTTSGMEGYYSIDSSAIASVQIDFKTSGTYVPAATKYVQDPGA